MNIPDDAWIPPVAKRALNLLAQQCDDLEDRNKDLAGAVVVLTKALRDIEAIADDNVDLDAHDWNHVSHICKTGGVTTAMSVTGT